MPNPLWRRDLHVVTDVLQLAGGERPQRRVPPSLRSFSGLALAADSLPELGQCLNDRLVGDQA